METVTISRFAELKEIVTGIFYRKQPEIILHDTEFITNKRISAIERFKILGFPHTRLEGWRNTNLSRALSYEYCFLPDAPSPDIDVETLFHCNVPHFETLLVSKLNGWFTHSSNPLKVLPNGMVYGSLAAAFRHFPELVEKYFSSCADINAEGLVALNTAMFQDGVFIYVPDNVSVEQTVQLVNIVDIKENLFINSRNLIILGNNSSLRLVHCDDSINHENTFINSVTEVIIGKNARLDHYKLQNKDDHTTIINSMFFSQAEGSNLTTNSISLNGGLIRNLVHVSLNGRQSNVEVSGLYLMDRYQHIDNQVQIHHIAPECTSRELFKGVLDDHASGVFNGHINVHRDAQLTNAYQTNKNILLTDKATIDTKPFLEIYADDVKCSHGATVGQLDPEAMFYIRSRGISEANARILLMYAFAAEVLNKISIPELHQRMDDMVKKRLRGELSQCEQCVLNCSSHEKKIEIPIDMSKL